jgi:hypothetical protein
MHARVTKLGEFSPNGNLFTVGCMMKMIEVALILGALFPHRTRNELVLAKNGLGYILSDFFTNSPGHPDACI